MKKNLLVLALCVAALVCLGLLMIYSTTYNEVNMPRFRSHITWLALGLALAPLLVWIDYHGWQRRSVLSIVVGACFLLLVAVFIPGVGVHTNGATRWIRGLGQPSEFAKPVLILLLAAWCARRSEGQMRELKRGFLVPAVMGAVPALLVFAEPDWGTAVLLGILTFAMLLLAGARLIYLGMAAALAAAALVVMVAHNSVRLERFMVFLDPETYRFGAGWQIWQSLLAIGSGGVWGDFLDGSLHKYGFVPEQQTDFIFARLGEETGFWGTTLVIFLYAAILLSGRQIMKGARDRFGQLLAGGCSTAIALQACINIAVATSMVPNKGLPLPFVSYGGSSLLAMFICLGLLGSVAWHSRERPVPNPPPLTSCAPA